MVDLSAKKIIIFDMDGVLVESEPYWRKSIISVFGDMGFLLSEADCKKTKGKNIVEVVAYWHEHFKWDTHDKSINSVALDIVHRVKQFVQELAQAPDGLKLALDYLKEKSLCLAIASSSSRELIETVIKALSIESYFDFYVGGDEVEYAKPHPQIFLEVCDHFNIFQREALVIEDSLNGIISAKAASIDVCWFETEDELKSNQLTLLEGLSDYKINHFDQIKELGF